MEVNKGIAVQNEDYDQAKILREQIERLKSVGMQLSSLDAQKQLAVQAENFDQAKRIKLEMDQIRQSALSVQGAASAGQSTKDESGRFGRNNDDPQVTQIVHQPLGGGPGGPANASNSFNNRVADSLTD